MKISSLAKVKCQKNNIQTVQVKNKSFHLAVLKLRICFPPKIVIRRNLRAHIARMNQDYRIEPTNRGSRRKLASYKMQTSFLVHQKRSLKKLWGTSTFWRQMVEQIRLFRVRLKQGKKVKKLLLERKVKTNSWRWPRSLKRRESRSRSHNKVSKTKSSQQLKRQIA